MLKQAIETFSLEYAKRIFGNTMIQKCNFNVYQVNGDIFFYNLLPLIGEKLFYLKVKIKFYSIFLYKN